MSIGTLQPQGTALSLRQTFTKAAQYYPVVLNTLDVSAMDRLQARCGHENVVPRDAAFYNDHFAQNQTAIGMVDKQGQLVAHALIRNHGTETKMLNVLVDPAHRGQGLHKRMIEDWLDAAAQEGFTSATARVRLSAVASFKNFSAAGFESVLREPSPDAPHEMTDVMVKSLRPVPYLPAIIP